MKFELDDKQLAMLEPWLADQKEKNKTRNQGAIGGAFVYTFCNTTLGQVAKVRNDATGDEIDLTDYESW